jgi:hypothetical protein
MHDAMRSSGQDKSKRDAKKKRTMRLASIVSLAALLSGCATGGSDVRPAMCGWLVNYAPAMQTRAAEELNALPADSTLRVLIEDYGELRVRIRGACAR